MRGAGALLVACFAALSAAATASVGPSITSLGAVPGYSSPTKAAVEFDFDDSGTCSAVAVAAGADAPSVAQIMDGTDSTGAAALATSAVYPAAAALGRFQQQTRYGELTATVMISNGVDGFPATPETLRVSEGFGSDFIIVDDIDGDGIRDAALGSPWADSPVRDTEGMVWILFMNADGTVRDGYPWMNGHESLSDLPDDDHNPQNFFAYQALFGTALAELTGQAGGRTLAVSMPRRARMFAISFDSSGKPTSSKVFGSPSAYNPCDDGSHFTSGSGTYFGDSMLGLDLNGDDVGDLLVTNWAAESYRGRLHWVIMNDDGTCASMKEMSTHHGAHLTPPWGDVAVGPAAPGIIGDLDNNGYDDIIFGMHRYRSNTGGTTIMFMGPPAEEGGMYSVIDTWMNGRDEAGSWAGDKTSAVLFSDFINVGTNPFYGIAVALPGDLDGNGVPDAVLSTRGKGFLGIHFHDDGSQDGVHNGQLLSVLRVNRNDFNGGDRSPYGTMYVPPLVPGAGGVGWLAVGTPGPFPSSTSGYYQLLPLRARAALTGMSSGAEYDVYVACEDSSATPVAEAAMVTVTVGCTTNDDCSVEGAECVSARCLQCYSDAECAGRRTCNIGLCSTCSDGVQNQDEVEVDCGGPLCGPCNLNLLIVDHASKNDCDRGSVDLAVITHVGIDALKEGLFYTLSVDTGPADAPTPLKVYKDGEGNHVLALRSAPVAGEYELTLTARSNQGAGTQALHVEVMCPAADVEADDDAADDDANSATLTGVLRLPGFDHTEFESNTADVQALADALVRGLGVDGNVAAFRVVSSAELDGTAEVTVQVDVPYSSLSSDRTVVVSLDTQRVANAGLAQRVAAYEHAARQLSRATSTCCTADVTVV